ncbi:uncharacterized protein LOC114437395 [Parambassis ranga]|uniref:Uncharacterized protein LOC114437395 n=1 Tax=Parambassis ranga TaxID=210632 RepID=A0A6P7ILE9_9TELE|nr:uncharacterized protein LOC114437395 [Parambassis ranga]
MHLAFVSLIVIAVHVSVPVECRPRLQDPKQQPQHRPGSSNTRTDIPAGTGRFNSELHGSMKQAVRKHLVILPVRTASSNFISIFDLKRKWFLCVGREGELYTSRQKDREDCLFRRIWLNVAHRHDAFYSSSGSRLLKLRAELQGNHLEPPEPSVALLGRALSSLVKRQRRSDEVNPSDPLRSESHPSHSLKDLKNVHHGKSDQDQAGAVSKETITSCDDPLRVLQPNRPVSPLKTNIADQAEHE